MIELKGEQHKRRLRFLKFAGALLKLAADELSNPGYRGCGDIEPDIMAILTESDKEHLQRQWSKENDEEYDGSFREQDSLWMRFFAEKMMREEL